MTRTTRLNQYEVRERIGAGGMGEVYRAHDTRLGRDVALKVLHRRYGEDPEGRRRLEREAHLVAQLTHPNIGAIHGLEEAGGVMFLVLELVEGATLAERLEQGSLGVHQALDIATQICAAGAEAHRRDILHRDLKPGNVMIGDDGRVRVLDFGLATCRSCGGASSSEPLDRTAQSAARPVSDSEPTVELRFEEIEAEQDPADATTDGLDGTPGYMSPEQIQGGPVDQRADVWAVGCILFEMLSGAPAFVGDSIVETVDNVLNRDPDWEALPDEMPEAARLLLAQMLEKRPPRRVGNLRDARVLLESALSIMDRRHPLKSSRRRRSMRSATVAALLAVPLMVAALALGARDGAGDVSVGSIAVLPIDNLTGEPDRDAFVEGLTEEITTELGGVGALKVVSRSSVRAVMETQAALPDIAKRLGVRGLVEASLWSSAPLRLSVRLYDAVEDVQLWGETFDADEVDLERVQSRIVQAIVARLGVELTPEERRLLDATRAVDPAASAAYLNGRYWISQRNSYKAIEEFRRAVQIDPGYGPAWAALANAYAYRLPSPEFMPKARHAAQTALHLDDGLGEAHAALAQVRFFFDWDWEAAEASFQRALVLAPSSAVVRQRYAGMLWALRRLDEARTQLGQARELDPMSLFIQLELARTDYFAGDYDAAEHGYRELLDLAPDFWWAHLFRGLNYQQSGTLEASAEELIAAFAGFRGDLSDRLRSGYELGAYDGLMRAWIAASEGDERVQPTSLAAQYTLLGEHDDAFAWLERAFEQRTRALVWIGVDPQFDPLRDDSRFTTLLARMGLAR